MNNVAFFVAAFSMAVTAGMAMAQSSPGQDWSGGWAFQSANDRSVGLSRATTIRQVQQAQQTQGPTTVLNTTNYYTTDNRMNYVDVTTNGAVTTDLQLGDRIGQNTNSIGSMNTGNTTIDVQGNSNSIHAINSAENTGCVDGSALTNTMPSPVGTASFGLGESAGSLGLGSMAGGGLATAGAWGMNAYQFGNIASPVQDCTR